MRLFAFLIFLILLLANSGCMPDERNEVYHQFQDQSWQRFNILSFELPVKASGSPQKVVVFIRHNEKFPYRRLDFHMIMRTPEGEERSREYSVPVRNDAEKPLGTCEDGNCEVSQVLKKDLHISSSGLLVIELENIIPRIETPGLLGIGIRLEKE